jgi:carbamate kinase
MKQQLIAHKRSFDASCDVSCSKTHLTWEVKEALRIVGAANGEVHRTSVVIAIGGNAIIKAGQRGTVDEQLANLRECCDHIVDLHEQGYRIVLTHGNGPQVGNLLLQNEAAEVPGQPVDVCGAMTQGQIGYLLQQTLMNALERRGLSAQVVSVTTQMVVDGADEAFDHPTKPVGPFYDEKRAATMRATRPDITLAEDSGRGWRRVVASPQPLEMVESEAVATLLRSGCLVIAAGGGGIPVVRRGGQLCGVEAVIDKDRASALVARQIGADCLIILTGVEHVCIDYGKPTQRSLARMSIREAQAWLDEGQFPAGSMEPIIQSALDYLRSGGEKVVITSIENLSAALAGTTGTVIMR